MGGCVFVRFFANCLSGMRRGLFSDPVPGDLGVLCRSTNGLEELWMTEDQTKTPIEERQLPWDGTKCYPPSWRGLFCSHGRTIVSVKSPIVGCVLSKQYYIVPRYALEIDRGFVRVSWQCTADAGMPCQECKTNTNTARNGRRQS
mmetsp:Transcript_11884/g.14549  ORF Transcript_11884/g.14549 Transcript_11884/m.14549 type:complete len:145 (+) Transcript_11884:449-883(+)